MKNSKSVVLEEWSFTGLTLQPGDSILFTLELKDDGKRFKHPEVFKHTHKCVKVETVDHAKVLYFEYFEGMENVYVIAVGKKSDK